GWNFGRSVWNNCTAHRNFGHRGRSNRTGLTVRRENAQSCLNRDFYLVGSPVVVTIQHREAKPMQTPIDHLYAVGTVSIGKIGDAEAISGDARKTRRCDKCRYSGDLLTTLRG